MNDRSYALSIWLLSLVIHYILCKIDVQGMLMLFDVGDCDFALLETWFFLKNYGLMHANLIPRHICETCSLGLVL